MIQFRVNAKTIQRDENFYTFVQLSREGSLVEVNFSVEIRAFRREKRAIEWNDSGI